MLPALLGLGLGRLLWYKYKDQVEDLSANIKNQNTVISSLEAELFTCKKYRTEAEGNVSMLRGKLREMEIAKAGDSISISNQKQAKSEIMPTSHDLSKDATSENVTTTQYIASNDLTTESTSSSNSTSITEDNDTLSTNTSQISSTLATENLDPWSIAIGNDKFQIIEGIGPKMEELLKENGIDQFNKLASTSNESLRNILSKYGDKYKMIDPNTWPQQAELADSKEWNKLMILQKSMVPTRGDIQNPKQTDSKLEKWLINGGIIRKWSQDDLKAIEGIGPKIKILLHEANIITWSDLSNSSVLRLKEILNDAGPRFALADPSTWPDQAKLASEGHWDELTKYQNMLHAGKVKK